MEFEVTRTTMPYRTVEKPCEEAYLKEVEKWNGYSLSERKYNEYIAQDGEMWRDRGTDHEVTKNGIRRKETFKVWCVTFDSLEELMAFIEKYGRVVLNRTEIEIYDDWRE